MVHIRHARSFASPPWVSPARVCRPGKCRLPAATCRAPQSGPWWHGRRRTPPVGPCRYHSSRGNGSVASSIPSQSSWGAGGPES